MTWAAVALLAAATVLSRAPLFTPRLAHWDAVNYALGLHEFNVAAHQPHPPGSPYYIWLGRAALALLGDDNAALVSLSVAASAGAVLTAYALGRVLFGPRTGLLAALILMTQPVFWGYGTMGTPWTLLAFLALTIGLTCAWLMRGRTGVVLPSAALMGLASGFRLDATVLLMPVWVWAVWRAERRWPRRLLALAVVAASALAWIVPVAASSGGFTLWSERLLALFAPVEPSAASVVRQFASNTFIAFGTLALAVGPALGLGLASRAPGPLDLRPTAPDRRTRAFWLLWIGPAFVFLWLVDSTEPGHALVFGGALSALAAAVLVRLTRTGPRLGLCATLLVAGQAGLFFFAAPWPERPAAWAPNAMVLNVSASGLREQQASLDAALTTIRRGFDPRDSLVLTITGQDPYRFMMYYLPEFRVRRLDPAAGSVLDARARRQGAWREVDGCLADTPDIRHVVWVLRTRSEPNTSPSGARLLSDPTDAPFQVWTVDPAPDTPPYLGFSLAEPCPRNPTGAG